jgi:alkanesulfonate monooxygenase SsuD/methylene tetrahydromethanopterin reductase-like flavin-dependent oxidoreductase (luciferase family)
MKFLVITLITHVPDPRTGVLKSTTDRLREVVDNAVLVEELGFDGYGVGERHERPFISSAPTVVLSHVAAHTSTIRLFTAVTTLSLLDPVRAFEDYSTLDHLSGGRLELIIGKGNGTAQAELFHVTTKDQWDRNREGYELFRRLWREDKVTWEGRFRPSLHEAETWPRPLQQPIRTWHGSATSRDSVDLAAKWGDPLFSANVTNPIEPYGELVDHYRERWEFYGHDPDHALVGAGSAGFFAAKTSQAAREAFRPIYQSRAAASVFESYEDALVRSSMLVGSPEEIVDKVSRYHERFGHEVLHISADKDGLTDQEHRDSLELFQSDVAPVLRASIPSRPFS